ncbi:MAG: TRM11 family SAM-dependent methyltransferase, partial [Nitrososphaerales archaeon]
MNSAKDALNKQQLRPPSLDLKNWLSFVKERNIIIDSLWLIPERDNSGSMKELHHGEFIPQIPRQVILRFTKPYDLVIDPFVGYGTTLVECQRLGRNGLGVELEHNIAEVANQRIKEEPNPYNVRVEVIEGDSREINFNEILHARNFVEASLIIAHPPYHDIIKYGRDPRNLANTRTLEDFLRTYGLILDNVLKVLAKNGYYVLVIGDKYTKGEWIPLGFHTMNETFKRGLKLKAICVKNFEETKAKRRQIHLWKYRVLRWGTYFFKHEYIMFFQT